MHLLARFVIATSVVFVLLGFCSAPARAQAIPVWLPGLSVKFIVRTMELGDLLNEAIADRLRRRPLFYPQPVLPSPPVILPVIDPATEPAPLRAPGSHPSLEAVLVP